MNSSLQRLKRQMQQADLTQAYVARMAGVTPTMVNKVINGRATSRKVLETIRALVTVRGNDR